MYRIVFSKAAAKDRALLAQAGLEPRARALLAQAGLEPRARALLDLLAQDPFRSPPPFEKLVGDLSGFYSRRLNRQHRLVYAVYPDRSTVQILRMWTHYGP